MRFVRSTSPWLAMFALCACRPTPATSPRGAASHPNAPVVAHVGDEVITTLDVEAVARAEGLRDAHDALERAIETRLLAREARRRGLDRDPLVVDLARRAGIQELLTHTVETTVRPDTLSAADLASGMRIRGFELSHGELFQVEHALVPVPANATPAQRDEARACATEIHDRMAATPSGRVDALGAVARQVCPRAHVRVEGLPAFDAEGRYPRGEMVAPFVAAATQLANRDDVSGVVETPFGEHVIVLMGRIPAVHREPSEVEAMVRDELLWRTRFHELERVLDALRARYGAEIREPALRAVDRIDLGERGAS